mmetsp:Transcript_25279/g.38220  ORF Transcript_25279/g.38220 Transcript_25279/m.38220 type:complete len:333 (-) Transcript_25279:28-1026(-)
MSSLSSQNQQQRAHDVGRRNETTWSDIDKTRLYGIGSVMYSALTVALHPLTVAKIRRQVATNNNQTTFNSGSFFQNYYRGLSVVVSLAIPARIIYISTLEFTRELIDTNTRQFIFNPPPAMAAYEKQLQSLSPFVTPFSGGIAGGMAAVSSQAIIVPMDVISQKLMVMEANMYRQKGSAMNVMKSIIATEGYGGLFRGFGLSLFTSLPAGTIWWASYAGVKDQLNHYADLNYPMEAIPVIARQGFVQVTSAFSAALAASILTQPLDTIKTRMQVAKGKPVFFSPVAVAKELASTSGLFKGLLPRIGHMGVWGSVLSAAYEYLKFVSRKDYNT